MRLKHHSHELKRHHLAQSSLFRDQGVGGSNPLSPTNLSWNQSITSTRSVISVPSSAILSSTSPTSFPFLINDLAATMNPWVTAKGSRVRMLRYPAKGERLSHL